MILANSGFESERWYKDELYGHQIPNKLWKEWEALWERIEELDRIFYERPFIDHRPPREPTVMDKFIYPVIQENIYKSKLFFTKIKDD